MRLLPEELAVCYREEWHLSVRAIVRDVCISFLQEQCVGLLQARKHRCPARGGIDRVIRSETVGLTSELEIMVRWYVVVKLPIMRV